MIRKGFKLLLILLWMILIFFFSMDTGVESSKKSSSFVVRASEFLIGRELSDLEKDNIVLKWETPFRKAAHFFLYFCLEIFVLWYLMEYHPITKRDLFFSLLFVFFYACSDEIHQLFIPERSGEILDVLIDTLGGLLSGSIFTYMRRKKNEQKKAIS